MNISTRSARRAIAGALIAVASLPILSGSAPAQSLDSLVRRALEAHPSLRSARLAIERSEAGARSSLAWEAPRLGVDFSMLPPDNPNPLARGETMLMAEQEIPLFGQNRAMADALARGADMGRADLAKAARTLRARIAGDYYTLWLLDRRATLAAQNRRHAELLYKSAETGYVAGRAAQSDLFTMSGEIESIAADEKDLAEERAEIQARVNTLLARPIGIPIVVTDSLPDYDLPPFDSLAARLSGNPELARMEAMAAAMRAEADAQEAMLRPMLMLRGGVIYMPEGHPVREGNLAALTGEHAGHDESGSMSHLDLAAGIMLTLPFAPWSRTGPEERAESFRLEAEQALADRDAMRLEMVAMLRSAYAKASRARARIHFYRMTRLPLIEKAIESAIGDYAAGRTTFASLIDSYHTRMLTHEDLAMKQMEYAMALSMIDELTGGSR